VLCFLIKVPVIKHSLKNWIPAFAGMTYHCPVYAAYNPVAAAFSRHPRAGGDPDCSLDDSIFNLDQDQTFLLVINGII